MTSLLRNFIKAVLPTSKARNEFSTKASLSWFAHAHFRESHTKEVPDGGGVRGLATLQILDNMRRIDPDNRPKPCEYFDLIGGTSTGG